MAADETSAVPVTEGALAAAAPRGRVHAGGASSRVLLDDGDDGGDASPESASPADDEGGVAAATAPACVVPCAQPPCLAPPFARALALAPPPVAAAARPRRALTAALCACVMLGYALAMFVNGLGRRLVVEAPRIDAAALAPAARLLYAQLDAMFALALFRCAAAAALVGAMACRGDGPAAPEPLTLRLAAPFVMGAANAGGYLPFMILCASSGVALWSSLVGCYVVLPVAYGLCVRREPRSPRKLAGITACVAAVALLALASADADAGGSTSDGGAGGAGAETEIHPVARAALFLACVAVWATCDTVAAYVARPPRAMHPAVVFAGAAVGFGAVALTAAALSRALEAGAPPPPPGGPSPPPAAAWWTGQAALAVAQALGVAAQFGTVLLGRAGADASSFLPLTSTYTVATALMGIAFLGERMAPVGYGGMAVGAAGVLLIATA